MVRAATEVVQVKIYLECGEYGTKTRCLMNRTIYKRQDLSRVISGGMKCDEEGFFSPSFTKWMIGGHAEEISWNQALPVLCRDTQQEREALPAKMAERINKRFDIVRGLMEKYQVPIPASMIDVPEFIVVTGLEFDELLKNVRLTPTEILKLIAPPLNEQRIVVTQREVHVEFDDFVGRVRCGGLGAVYTVASEKAPDSVNLYGFIFAKDGTMTPEIPDVVTHLLTKEGVNYKAVKPGLLQVVI